MLLEITLILLVIIALIRLSNRKPDGLPPGEWGIPVLGYLPFMETKLAKTTLELYHKYGDIFTLKIGSLVCVFVADYNAVKAAFNKTEFSGRPDLYTFKVFFNIENKTYGIIASDGATWETNRRFTMRVLRDFGMGKSRMGEDILIEASHLINYYKEEVDKPFNVDHSLNLAILNMTFKLLADVRYDIHDEEVKHLVELMSQNIRLIDGPIAIMNFFPSLIPYVPKFIRNNWMKVDVMEHGRDKIVELLEKLVGEHKQALDPTSPRDFIDMYLIEMAARKEESEQTHFDLKNLYTIMLDFFDAGSDTTSTTLRWFFMYMVRYPKIQKKVQQQIDSVVPHSRFPSLEDKQSLPYLEALLHEINRIVTLSPNAVPHEVIMDTSLKGYKIPKGTLVFPCIDICHRDPKYWKNPNKLDLDHFLDAEGNFVSKKEGYFPFSTGRRQCAGEPLAKMMLFIFMGAILQNFEIHEPEGQIFTFEPLETVNVINVPQEFKVILKKRI